jgi:hypothetical protein
MPRSGRLLSNRIDIPFITMQLRYLKCISTSPAAKIFEKFSPRLSISVGDGRSVCPASGAPRAQPLEHGPLADRLRPRASTR